MNAAQNNIPVSQKKYLVTKTKLAFLLTISFLVASPIINNINGLSIKYYNISILGPFFYSIFMAFFIIFALFSSRKRTNFFGVCTAILLLFFIQYTLGFTQLDEFQYYIKFFLPFLIYLSLKYVPFSQSDLFKLDLWWRRSILLYSIFILISFCIGFQYWEGKGYYGFIYALNDLTLVLLLGFYPIMNRNTFTGKAIYISSVLLTFSKAIIFFIPLLILHYFRYIHEAVRNRKNLFMKFLSVGLLLLVLLFFAQYFCSYLTDLLGTYYKNSPAKFIETFQKDPDSVYAFLTFGRSRYLQIMMDKLDQKSLLEVLIGSGISGAAKFTGGKDGIEMDPFDVFNIFGILGLVLITFFYYTKLFLYKKTTRIFKLTYAMCMLYSIFGGHLVMNPMSNSFYAIYLIILSKSPPDARK
jgi:hypothetical protein